MQSLIRPSQGDRFISSRSLCDDAAAIFGTKVEIFSNDKSEEELEERRNS